MNGTFLGPWEVDEVRNFVSLVDFRPREIADYQAG